MTNILSVDWAFHKTGLAFYDSETKTLTLSTYTIKDTIKIKWWDLDFFNWYMKQLHFMMLKNDLLQADIILIEVGFGKVDKMSLLYSWFYSFWAHLSNQKEVIYINSSLWIKQVLNVNNMNKIDKNMDKQLLKELFYKRFNTLEQFTQDEIDATMMLLWKYPDIEIKEIKRIS